MIRKSFIFLERIGAIKERQIWSQGIFSWQDFFSSEKIIGISKRSKAYLDRKLKKAQDSLYRFDSSYYCPILPSTETWRLYDFFKEETVFLDIETSGVTRHDDITIIGLFDGIETKTMIKGINLDIVLLKEFLKNFKLIVTFNGSSFDLPFIKKRYPGVIPDIPHIDAMHLCDRIGLNGGLKEIEKKVNLKRTDTIQRFYGGDPFRLWRMYHATGDDYYLNLLIEYNEFDVINLKSVLEIAIKKSEKKLFNSFPKL